jgi:hypothetical protein
MFQSQYPMEVVEADNLCPKCGKAGYAIYRNPGSDLTCGDNHVWNYIRRVERKIMPDGRAHNVKVWFEVEVKHDLVDPLKKIISGDLRTK